jgi:PAS domain S-box-containing protein
MLSRQGFEAVLASKLARCPYTGGFAVKSVPRWMMAVFVSVILGVGGGGVWLYQDQHGTYRKDAENELQAITRLKMEQLIQWRSERLADAAAIMDSPLLGEVVAKWFQTQDREQEEKILTLFRSTVKHYRYRDVLLVDASGRVLLSNSSRHYALHEDVVGAIAAALRDRQPVLSDLHVGPGDVPPHLDVVAPLSTGNGGAVILEVAASEFLFPLIQSWPVPSRSAESLLIRRDGDAVLFLNELRHKQGTALKLRIPLTQADTPAVMAVLGTEGVVNGRDYRGVEVISIVKHIPDSPWFLVAKEDAAEVFAAWRFRSFLILALILGCIIATAGGLGIVWQRNLKARYRALFEAEAVRRNIEGLYRSLFENMLNGFAYCRLVYENDRPKDIVFLAVNNAFSSMTGLKDVVGRKAAEVIPGIWEKDADLLETYARVVKTGASEKFETYLASMEMWFSMSVYRPQEGHFVVLFDDITRRKRAEQGVRESEERYRLLADNAEDFVALNDTQGNRLYISPSFYRVTGWTSEEIQWTDWRARMHPEDVEIAEKARQANLAGKITNIEYRYRCRDGSWMWLESRCKPIRDDDGKVKHLLLWSRDITARKHAELALRESEGLLRSIADHTEDMILVKDRDSRYLFMNQAGLRFVERSLDQVLGRTDVDWNPNTAEATGFMVADRRVVASGQAETIEEEVTSPDGVKRIFLTAKTPRLDAEGRVTGVVGICRDITRRKRMMEALQESEERFRTLYTSMTEIVALHEVVTDSEGRAADYRVVDVNPAFAKSTGFSRDRAIGALASELYGTEKAPFLEIYARVADTGEPASFEAFFAPLARHFEISVFSPKRGQFATVASDITGRKETEMRLAKQQKLLEGMNRVLHEAIRCESEEELAAKCLTLAQELTDSQFGFVNELNATGSMDCLAVTEAGWAACKLQDMEKDVLLKGIPVRGMSASVIHGSDSVIVNDTAAHPDRVELPSWHPLIDRFLGVPLKMANHATGLIGLANKPSDYDADDRQAAESVAAVFVEALQRLRGRKQIRALNAFLDGRVRERTSQLETANKEMESFSYSVSHDLRAPLRAISGFASMLTEDHAKQLDADGKRLLGVINSEAARMGQLIDDLLEFSRAGRRAMDATEVNMNALAKIAYDDCAAQASGRDIRFKLHPLPPAQGDATMLRQVWVNLLSNAIKYTRPKPVAEIEVSGRLDNGAMVYCVKDNGTGFDMRYADKLFGVFQRLHSETEFEGTGVGLALVQRIIQRHGGRIWAESKLNEGATFYFTLLAGKE